MTTTEIGAKIKELRLQKGYTMRELGALVGVGASTVNKWETGFIKDMRSDKIMVTAKVLGVTPAYLMGWEDKPVSSIVSDYTTLESASLSKEEIALIKIYRALNGEDAIKLSTFAQNLFNKMMEGVPVKKPEVKE